MQFSLRLRELMEVWVMAVGAFLVFVYGVMAFPVFRSLRSSLIMVGQRDSEGSCSGLGLSGYFVPTFILRVLDNGVYGFTCASCAFCCLGGLGGWSVALMKEVGILGSLTIRGGSLRDCG